MPSREKSKSSVSWPNTNAGFLSHIAEKKLPWSGKLLDDSDTLAGVRNTDGRQTVFILAAAVTAALFGALCRPLLAHSIVFVDNDRLSDWKGGFSAIFFFLDFSRFDVDKLHWLCLSRFRRHLRMVVSWEFVAQVRAYFPRHTFVLLHRNDALVGAGAIWNLVPLGSHHLSTRSSLLDFFKGIFCLLVICGCCWIAAKK